MTFACTLDHKTGYDIGWDLAHLGLPLFKDAQEAIVNGHRDYLRQNGRNYRIADKFERRWIRLRQGAWVRGRYFSREVTPDFLESISIPICPVTLEHLTDGERLPTDWTVDRLNNEAAYAKGNLVVMSFRANQAKSDLSLAQVQEFAEKGDSQNRLKPAEWARLACLMSRVCTHGTDMELRPCLTVLPPSINFLVSDLLQLYLMLQYEGGPRTLIGRLKDCASTVEKRRLFDKLMRRMRQARYRVRYRFEMMSVPAVFHAFCAWYNALSPRELKALDTCFAQFAGAMSSDPTPFDSPELALETQGFVISKASFVAALQASRQGDICALLEQ